MKLSSIFPKKQGNRGSTPVELCVSKRGELVRLVLVDQRFYDLLKMPFNDLIELVKRQVDAVVGDATLWEIVGPDAFTTIARTYQQSTFFSLLSFLLGYLCIEQSRL